MCKCKLSRMEKTTEREMDPSKYPAEIKLQYLKRVCRDMKLPIRFSYDADRGIELRVTFPAGTEVE